MLVKLVPQYVERHCDPSVLRRVEREMTEKDLEYYDRVGWKHYRDEDLITTYLPELGDKLCFGRWQDTYVVEFKGRRWKVTFWRPDYDEPWKPDGHVLFEETTEPLTVPCSVGEPEYRRNYSVYFFGQPRWVQTTQYPADQDGNPCHHLATIESGWGDSGNENYLIALDETGIPVKLYYEASCC